jgi:hypothetical protein
LRGLYNCEIRLRDNPLTLLRCPELTRGGQLSSELSLRYAKAKVSRRMDRIRLSSTALSRQRTFRRDREAARVNDAGRPVFVLGYQ